jgi:hypothetical protein
MKRVENFKNKLLNSWKIWKLFPRNPKSAERLKSRVLSVSIILQGTFKF